MRYRERVVACFKALATGDAIGKQTEMLSHPDVRLNPKCLFDISDEIRRVL